MRKIVVCLFAMVAYGMFFPVMAQTRFGVKGGLNVSSVHLNSDIMKADNVTGFQLGPMVETMIPVIGIGLDAAFLYARKGMDLKSGTGLTEHVKTSYFDIPVNLKWKFGLYMAKLYVAAGPYFDLRIGGDKYWEVPGDISGQAKAKAFSTGLNIGVGAELFSHFQAGFNYGWGLTDNYSTERTGSVSAKNRGWSVSAAILF